jgi:hypothetical protein
VVSALSLPAVQAQSVSRQDDRAAPTPQIERDGSVHSIVMTMHMTMTEHVYRINTASGSFPGILHQKYGDKVEYYDLSEIPPVLRTLYSNEILSKERDQKWRHPPAMANYSAQELADVISFLKFATTGSQLAIAPADVDPNR